MKNYNLKELMNLHLAIVEDMNLLYNELQEINEQIYEKIELYNHGLKEGRLMLRPHRQTYEKYRLVDMGKVPIEVIQEFKEHMNDYSIREET